MKYRVVQEHHGRFGHLEVGQVLDSEDGKLPACYQRALDEAPSLFKAERPERAVRKSKVETR